MLDYYKMELLFPAGGLLVLALSSQSAASDDSIGSLQDVIFSQDLLRLEKTVARAEPYKSLREAHLVLKVINGVKLTAENKKVHDDGTTL